jgi:hypothetical protein
LWQRVFPDYCRVVGPRQCGIRNVGAGPQRHGSDEYDFRDQAGNLSGRYVEDVPNSQEIVASICGICRFSALSVSDGTLVENAGCQL